MAFSVIKDNYFSSKVIKNRVRYMGYKTLRGFALKNYPINMLVLKRQFKYDFKL